MPDGTTVMCRVLGHVLGHMLDHVMDHVICDDPTVTDTGVPERPLPCESDRRC